MNIYMIRLSLILAAIVMIAVSFFIFRRECKSEITLLLSKLFFIDLMPKSFKKIVSRIFFSMLVYSILFSVFIFLKDKYLHYKFLSHVISSLEELIKDISPLITASIAVYIGHEARKITKEQKEIAKNKLIMDIYDKRAQFLIPADKFRHELLKTIGKIKAIQRHGGYNEDPDKMKPYFDKVNLSVEALGHTYLELCRFRDTNRAFYLKEEYEIIRNIVKSSYNTRKEIKKEISKLKSGETVDLEKIKENYNIQFSLFRKKIEKNIPHVIKTHFS